MDDARLDEIASELLSWGVLERAPDGALALTRRFRGALARAAMALQQEEKSGARPQGDPVANTVAAALGAFPLPEGAAKQPDHIAFVTAIQLRSLPPAVREMLGV